jgi:two-component system alkaline phosphatase synthesis response regulator PhoP
MKIFTAMNLSDLPIFEDGRLRIDSRNGKAFLHGRFLELTHKEFSLLALLASRAGSVVLRGELLELVWGYPRTSATRTLDVHVRRLRKKLGERNEPFIETVFRQGYRLVTRPARMETAHPSAEFGFLQAAGA